MQFTTADSTRHLKTVWRGEKSWHWKAIYIGHVQPLGRRTFWRDRFMWQLHLTPIHVGRAGDTWTAGFCFGKRTAYLYSHR